MVQAVRGGVTGPQAWSEVDVVLDLPGQAANLVTETTIITGSQEPAAIPVISIVGTIETGLFLSHARISANNYVIGIGNSTAGAVDPAIKTYAAQSLRPGVFRQNIPGSFQAVLQDRVSVDLPPIAANANGLAVVALNGVETGDIVLASPAAVINAGVAFNYARAITNQIQVFAHNLTAGAIDPAAVDFDFTVLKPQPGARQGPSGPILGQVNPVAIDHPAVAALTVVEATGTISPLTAAIAASGATAHIVPRAALPAGLAISHARISANNTIAVGLCNVTGVAIDPVSITYDVLTFNRSGLAA